MQFWRINKNATESVHDLLAYQIHILTLMVIPFTHCHQFNQQLVDF